MIRVQWTGRLGNQLFQYAIGRILAEDLGYALESPAIEAFAATRDPVRGAAVRRMRSLRELGSEQMLALDVVRANRGRLGYLVDGFFQRYEYYKESKDRIRGWFNRDRPRATGATPRDVVVHVRRTQVGTDGPVFYPIDDETITIGGRTIPFGAASRRHAIAMGLVHDAHVIASPDLLPFEYYEKILDAMTFDRLIICTDVPADPYLDGFSKYRPIVTAEMMMDDFNLLRGASRIVASISTFSWWAAFLSDAREIYLPLPEYGNWRDPARSVNLAVDDEPRYTIVPVRAEGTFF